MKKPSDSFSKASRSASDQGGASGDALAAAPWPRPPRPGTPNRLACPYSRSRWRFCPLSIAAVDRRVERRAARVQRVEACRS